MTAHKTRQSFGYCLKKARLYRGKSQHMLAQKSGIGRGRITHFETEYSQPNAAQILQLADALIVDFSTTRTFGWWWAPSGGWGYRKGE